MNPRILLLGAIGVSLPWLMGAAARSAEGDVQLSYGAGSYQAASCGGIKQTRFEELASRAEAVLPVAVEHRVGLRLDVGAVREENQFTEQTADGRERQYTTGGILWGARPALLWQGPWASANAGWQWLGHSGFPALGVQLGPKRLHGYLGMLDGGLSGGFYDGLGILGGMGNSKIWLSRAGIGGEWSGLGLSGQIGLTSLDTRALGEFSVRGRLSWGSWLLSGRLGGTEPNWQIVLGISVPMFASEEQKAAAPF